MKKRTKFIYNGFLMTAVGLAMRGTQLLFGAYVARAVGAEGVGLNTLVMMVYSFALTFATSGISLTVTRLVATGLGEGREADVGKIIKGAFAYAFTFGAVASLLLMLLSHIIGVSIIGDSVSVTALRILSLSLIPSAFSAVISGYFVAVRRVTLNAITQVSGQLFRIGITVVLLTRSGGDGSIVSLAFGVTLAELAAFLVALPELIVDRARSSGSQGMTVKPVAKMALPLAVSAYLRSALLTLEHNLIPKSLERHGESKNTALSNYGYLHGMALPLILYPMTPLSSFSGLLVPELAEAKGAGLTVRMERIASRALNVTLVYAIVSAVFIYRFSEELGFAVYNSYDVGAFIAILAPVVPIMYLDHVADAILKGIGEHIYSMWVNIADAVLSVVLVIVLIPIMGIAGYAVVIICMEAFNFVLSVLRLKKRIPFRLDILRSALLPLLSSLGAAILSEAAFSISGSEITPVLLVLELVFAVCLFIAISISLRALLSLIKILPKNKASAHK